MQSHLMHLNMKWTTVLHAVDVSDQPVYALTKELQFCNQEIFCQFFPIFRQLHIDQSLLVIHGQLIEGSGLVKILTESKFSMTGLSAVVDVNNIKRPRYTFKLLYVYFLSNFVRLRL